MTCRCHSDEGLYGSLHDCPACGHRSLDIQRGWAGCERRACGWQTQDRRRYGVLARWPAFGLFTEGGELVGTIRAESAHAARVLFIGAGLRGARVRRMNDESPPS